MKRPFLTISIIILTAGLCYFVLCMDCFANGFGWTTITEFKYYGFKNPKNQDSIYKFVLADTDKIKTIFANVKKSEGYFPKGASRFATITFKNKKTITIQMIAGGYTNFCVIGKDIWNDEWYNIDRTKTTEWGNYLSGLDREIEK